jgi:hypothetical protein
MNGKPASKPGSRVSSEASPAVDKVIDELAAQDIHTLRDYVQRTLGEESDGWADPRSHGDCPAIHALGNVFTAAADQPITHIPPSIELTIDGTVYDPSDIVRFDGQPLHFVLSGSDLAAFTDPWPIKTAVGNRAFRGVLYPTDSGMTVDEHGRPFYKVGGSDGGSRTRTPPWQVNYGSLKMFSDINWGGDWFWLDEGWAWPDLTRVWRNKVLFFHGNWNDVISSVTGTASMVTYCEHIYYKGSTLTVPERRPQDSLPNLHVLGWGDRISSVIHWPPA